MKKSNKLVLLAFSVLFCSVIANAFFIKNNVKKFEEPCRPELEMGQGQFLEDECFLSYSHLFVSVPDVELVSGSSDFVKVEGYENAIWVQNMEVRNDTLFIAKKEHCMPNYVTDESINAVKYFVSADKLKSITVGVDGSINHPLKPYGSYADGKPAYKQHELEKHTFKFDDIDINIIGNGALDLILDGKNITMNYLKTNVKPGYGFTTRYRVINNITTNQSLMGNLEELHVNKAENKIGLNALNLDVNRVVINASKNKTNQISGNIAVSVSDHLEAYLYSDLDVKYKGNPTIIKEETGYGRVLNYNDAP